jgi:hypothetical protein
LIEALVARHALADGQHEQLGHRLAALGRDMKFVFVLAEFEGERALEESHAPIKQVALVFRAFGFVR